MTLQDTIVMVPIGLAVVYVAYRGWRTFAGRSGCGCGSSCSSQSAAGSNGPVVCELVQLNPPEKSHVQHPRPEVQDPKSEVSDTPL